MDIVLFEKDWDRFNVVPHFSTTNRTFVHVAKLYQSMGIKNHLFMLALHDERLLDIDPFNPYLTDMEMMLVTAECKINPWYYFREIARAPGQAGAAARPFQANRGNMALFWSFFNHAMSLLIQVRQTGKSFSTDTLASYLLQIRCKDTQINLLTKDETLRRANIQRIKDIFDELPFYLDARTKKDANNTELITIKERNNLYQGHLPQASEKLAGNVGRGLTSPIFFVDEPPFQANIHEALPAALAAGSEARAIARSVGEPHGTILTTTAGKKDTKEGAYIYKLMSNMAEWSDRFFDCKDAEEFEKVVCANNRSEDRRSEGNFRVNITMNHRQMGKDDEWLKRRIAESVATGDAANRDFFNYWSSGTATNPLSIETIERIRGSMRDPSYSEICEPGGYIVRWFIPEKEIQARMSTGSKIVVLDTSEASGGDDISLRVTDIETGECLAAGTYNNTNIITFSEWVATWITRWETTTVLIERRSTGSSVLDMLLLILPSRNIDPFKRLFNMVVQNAEEDKDRFKEACEPLGRRPDDIYVKNKRAFGFATSGSGLTSRSGLYSQTLHSAAKQVGHLVYDKTTIDQVASLITKNGRIDHPSGEHDDMCFIGSTLVRTIDGNRPIKDIKLGDLVLTRQGYKPVVKLFRSEKEVITKFGLTGTANHPFITPSGEVQFKDLTPESIVYVWNEKQLSIEEKAITDTLTRKEYSTGSISTDTTNGKLRPLPFIARSTRTILERFRQASISITKMETTSIMTPVTLNVSPQPSICVSITSRETDQRLQGLKAVQKISKTGGSRTVKRLSSSLSRTVKNLKGLLTGEKIIQNSPEKSPEQLLLKAQKPGVRKEMVYNLMVDQCHEYFVNDILVHNCISWLLSHWFMTKATNLRHYGIDPTHVLRSLRQAKILSPREQIKANEQMEYRRRIEELLDLMKKSTDNVLIMRQEHELRNIYSRLELQEDERINVDEVIAKARQDRVRGRMERMAGIQSRPVQTSIPSLPQLTQRPVVGSWQPPGPFYWQR